MCSIRNIILILMIVSGIQSLKYTCAYNKNTKCECNNVSTDKFLVRCTSERATHVLPTFTIDVRVNTIYMFLYGSFDENTNITDILFTWPGLRLLNVKNTNIKCETQYNYNERTEIICLQRPTTTPAYLRTTRKQGSTYPRATTRQSSTTTTTTTTSTDLRTARGQSSTYLTTRGDTITTTTTAINATPSMNNNITTNNTRDILQNNDGFSTGYIIAITTATILTTVLLIIIGIVMYVIIRRRIRQAGYEINNPIYHGLNLAMNDAAEMDGESDL